MVLRPVKDHPGDPLHFLQGLRQTGGLLIGDVGRHDPCGPQGGKFLLHEGQAPPRLRLRGQVGGDVVVDLHLGDGGRAEQARRQKNQIERLPFVHDEAGELINRALLLFVRHGPHPFFHMM